MRIAVRLILGAFFAISSFHLQAALITWTLENVIFDDGGTASGFVTFDPSVPFVPGRFNTKYLTSFDIKATPGTVFTTPFEYSPSNTDAYVPYYVNIFSAPGSPRLRHGLPQRTLRLQAVGGFSEMGGAVEIRPEDSAENLVGEDFTSGNNLLFRSITGGRMVGVVVPEPTSFAFIVSLTLLGLSAPIKKLRVSRSRFARLCKRS